MHPAIQPTLCVIGYPVGGIAMQFAFERALAEAELDWRFVSFDVHPDALDDAVRGAKALGIEGIAVAPPFASRIAAHADQIEQSSQAADWIDSLQRVEGRWVGSNQLGSAVVQLAARAVESLNQAIVLGCGPQAKAVAAHFAAGGIRCRFVTTDADDLPLADRETGELPGIVDRLSLDDVDHHSVLVRADNRSGSPCGLSQIEARLTERVGCCLEISLDPPDQIPPSPQRTDVSAVDVVVQSLANCFSNWTGRQPNRAVLHEAVEEYFEL